MSENVTQKENLTTAQVESAIQAVRSKGWDINPYTVADEVKVSPADIAKNAEFMQLIVHARGGDLSFQIAPDQRVSELEAEVRNLQDKLSSSQELAAMPSNDDVLNEQVKALLSSESDEQVKHLERELETAYAQVVALEEEKVDLTRSVTGLEKINEALNFRMRELEAETAELKKVAASQPVQAKSNEEMETINREMALRLEELISNNRANNEHIALLEATNIQHESLILELEAKLAELQQEADMLALQLQNAFHVGYQKGAADNTPAGTAPAQTPEAMAAREAQARQQVQEISQELTGEFGAPPSHVATGDQVVTTPGQYYEMHNEMPNVEIRNQAQKPEEDPEDTQVNGWGPEADHVLNFARTGPYVASTFNPLESLSWRDLETVYSMGVLSIRDFSRNLTDYTTNTDTPIQTAMEQAKAEQQSSADETIQPFHSAPGEPAESARVPRPTFPDDTIQPNAGLTPVKRQVIPFPDETVETKAFSEAELLSAQSQYSEVQQLFTQEAQPGYQEPHLDEYGQPVGDDSSPQTMMYSETPPVDAGAEPPKADGALDFIDELIDLDKLDIFDSLEDLAELGNIDVLNEPMHINFDDMNEATTESPAVADPSAPVADPAAPVSDTELRDLIANRISAASQDSSGEQTVRTPAAPEVEEDTTKQKAIPGLSRKFVGTKAAQGAPPGEPAPAASMASSTTNASVLSKHIPPEIRKACMILGVRPEEITKELVNKEWKKQITAVHPDLAGGDTESSIYLNTAKDTLLRWLDQNTPKLGGKFGSKGGSSPFTGKNKSDDKS